MTNREYVIQFFTRRLQEAEDSLLERAYTNGIGLNGEIECICEACRRLYPNKCTPVGEPCTMTSEEWCGLEAAYKKN